jgi:hypothetical protein
VRFFAESPVVIMAVVICVCGVVLSVVSLSDFTPTARLVYAFGTSLVLLVASYCTMRRELFRLLTRSLLMSMLNPAISSATFLFKTDTLKQYPDGPHFLPSFYVTAVGIVQGVFSLLSIATYTYWMTGWRYRSLYYLGAFMGTVLGLPNVLFYMRYNTAWGIDDRWFTIGEEAIVSLTSQWQSISSFLLISQLCTPGSEASIFSIIAGVNNLGALLSAISGSWLVATMGVTPTGADNETTKFDQLWLVSLICIFLPLCGLPLIPWAIPDAGQKDNLQELLQKEEHERSARSEHPE